MPAHDTVTLFEIVRPLACPDFASKEGVSAGVACPSSNNVPSYSREVRHDWSDEDIDAWVAACPVHTPADPHDHRFVMRLVAEGTPSWENLWSGWAPVIARSHEDGSLQRAAPRQKDSPTLALRSILMLALKLRSKAKRDMKAEQVSEFAEHFIRFCREGGVEPSILRGEGEDG